MFQSIKKVIVGVVAAGLLMTSVAFAADTPSATKVDKEPVDSTVAVAGTDSKGNEVSATTKKDGTATVTAVGKKDAKSVKVADSVVVNGVKYTVTTIGAKAFSSSAKTVKSVTLPVTVKTISKDAFKNCKKLTKITLKITKSINVEKGAFKGAKTKNMKIVVSKKMSDKELKKFQKALKKAGYKGEVVKK